MRLSRLFLAVVVVPLAACDELTGLGDRSRRSGERHLPTHSERRSECAARRVVELGCAAERAGELVQRVRTRRPRRPVGTCAPRRRRRRSTTPAFPRPSTTSARATRTARRSRSRTSSPSTSSLRDLPAPQGLSSISLNGGDPARRGGATRSTASHGDVRPLSRLLHEL